MLIPEIMVYIGVHEDTFLMYTIFCSKYALFGCGVHGVHEKCLPFLKRVIWSPSPMFQFYRTVGKVMYTMYTNAKNNVGAFFFGVHGL